MAPESQPELWQRLSLFTRQCQQKTLSQRFATDPQRAQRYSTEVGELHVDYSKQHLDDDIAQALTALAQLSQTHDKLSDLRNGALCNNTEGRSANYAELRRWAEHQHSDDSNIQAMYAAMAQLCEKLRSGELRSPANKPYTHLVNIGIGGSDFGPRLLNEALREDQQGRFDCRFLSNIDPSCVTNTLQELPADSTLFIVASKSFTTLETLANARAAKHWLQEQCPNQNIDQQFIAITAKPEAAETLGIPKDQILAVPDWVGGRFSLWSGFGFIVAANYGWPCFLDFLQGGAEIDTHMEQAPGEENLPLRLALLDVWYRNSWGTSALTVLPYCHRLRLLPDYLQQLYMESAGKGVNRDGEPLSLASGGLIMGSEGSNGQHSFYQLLHQGSDMIPCDFIAVLNTGTAHKDQQEALLANCFAQSLALMQGKSADVIEDELIAAGHPPAEARQLASHQAMPGNRPSTTIVMDDITPRSLGNLIALYEYRLICASFIWDINPFDQWGVELGKKLSRDLQGKLAGKSGTELDSSTEQLIARAIARRR